MVEYTKLKQVSLKDHPEIREEWVQNVIAEDPSILGLGEVYLRDRERIQPKAGRLDLLLQDPETSRRYEVEIQLGATDPSHIIRALEYWDIERRRYPQYDHCAVIVAEEITARFLNVISLFNGQIPLIAIQMKAVETEGHVSLFFTKVLDEIALGLVDEDEDAASAPADRAYWESKSNPKIVKLADHLLSELKELEPTLELNYNKHYIGLSRNGQAFNFVTFRPKKQRFNLEVKLPRTDAIDELIEGSGIDTLEYNSRWSMYRLSLRPEDLQKSRDVVERLCRDAYTRRVSQ